MAEEKKVSDKKEEKNVEKKDEKPVEKKEAKVETKAKDTKVEAKEEKKETKSTEKSKSEEKPKKKDKKDEKKVDIVSENVYTIPLTKVHHTKPHYRRANKAIAAIIFYLRKHTKSENIKIDDGLNRHVWTRGSSKPPRRVQVKAVKDSEQKVVASLLK